MWIARDESGKLHLFESEPFRDHNPSGQGIWQPSFEDLVCMRICDDWFDIKWEDEPKQVKFIEIEKE